MRVRYHLLEQYLVPYLDRMGALVSTGGLLLRPNCIGMQLTLALETCKRTGCDYAASLKAVAPLALRLVARGPAVMLVTTVVGRSAFAAFEAVFSLGFSDCRHSFIFCLRNFEDCFILTSQISKGFSGWGCPSAFFSSGLGIPFRRGTSPS